MSLKWAQEGPGPSLDAASAKGLGPTGTRGSRQCPSSCSGAHHVAPHVAAHVPLPSGAQRGSAEPPSLAQPHRTAPAIIQAQPPAPAPSRTAWAKRELPRAAQAKRQKRQRQTSGRPEDPTPTACQARQVRVGGRHGALQGTPHERSVNRPSVPRLCRGIECLADAHRMPIECYAIACAGRLRFRGSGSRGWTAWPCPGSLRS